MKNNNLPKREDAGLLVHIEHSKPIEVSDFIKSLDAVNGLYSDFVQTYGVGSEMSKSKLYVEKIEHGCIDIILREVTAAGLLSFIENANIMYDFAGHIKEIVNFLTKREGAMPKLSLKQWKEVKDMFEVTAKDEKAITEIGAINVNDKSMTFNGCIFNFGDSNNSQNQVSRYIADASTPENGNIYRRQFMTIYQVQNSDNKDSKGNKAVIETISKNRLSLAFATDELRDLILMSENNPMLKVYHVDVELINIAGKPKIYNVIALHEILDIE